MVQEILAGMSKDELQAKTEAPLKHSNDLKDVGSACGPVSADKLSGEMTMATFVLLHGAYQGGWIWKPVRERLAAAGHTVFAPTLDGCAERADALRPGIDTEAHGAEIAKLLEFEDLNDVVLVATSSGGMVMAAAAERVPESH